MEKKSKHTEADRERTQYILINQVLAFNFWCNIYAKFNNLQLKAKYQRVFISLPNGLKYFSVERLFTQTPTFCSLI